MILARVAVFGAILCTLWFNGSYAYAKASGEAQQLAMVAVAQALAGALAPIQARADLAAVGA